MDISIKIELTDNLRDIDLTCKLKCSSLDGEYCNCGMIERIVEVVENLNIEPSEDIVDEAYNKGFEDGKTEAQETAEMNYDTIIDSLKGLEKEDHNLINIKVIIDEIKSLY